MVKYNANDQSYPLKRKAAMQAVNASIRAFKRYKSAGTPKLIRAPRMGAGAFGGSAFGAGASALAAYSGVRSMLATTRSTTLKTGRIVNEGSVGQYSSFTLRNKNYYSKDVHASLAPVASTFSAATQGISAIGLQNIMVPLTMFSNADVLQLYTDLGGSLKRFLLERCRGEVLLSNIMLSNCTIDIYDCIARKDCGTAEQTDASSAWSGGDTGEGTASIYTKLGSTPFSVEDFNLYWKVLQKTRVVLPSGALHKHHVSIDANKVMTPGYITNTAKIFRDLTYNCLVVYHGAPANDVTTQTSVSIGKGALNVVQGKEYICKVLSTQVANVIDHTTLATTFAAGEQVLDVGGSTVIANAEA